jgi:hypothetical protein
MARSAQGAASRPWLLRRCDRRQERARWPDLIEDDAVSPGGGHSMDWRFAEALAVDTRQAVTRWWARRRSAAAPIPDRLVDDLQTARLALDEAIQHRLWDLATMLPEPQRSEFIKKIAELDPWHVLSKMATGRAQPEPAAGEREAASEDDRDLIAALKDRGRRRERLERPDFPSKARRRLRDLVHGRGSLAATLKDDDACLMLRFGALLCGMIQVDLGVHAEPDPDDVRAELAMLSEADARRAAQAVLGDRLVGSDERGRPGDLEILRFVRLVIVVVWRRHRRYRIKSTITRRSARSPSLGDRPNSDIQLILDLLACHAPSKTAEAVADLIKNARAPKRRE